MAKGREMKNIKIKIAAAAGALALLGSTITTSAIAVEWGSVGFGASFGAAHVEASGSETLYRGIGALTPTKDESATEDSQAVIASAHVQITLGDQWFGKGNGFAIGVEHFFGEATFDNVYEEVIDIKGSATAAKTIGKNYAEVTLENLNTVFIETPGVTPLGIFLKAGWSEMDIITKEEMFTGATYGNAAVDGVLVGFGFKKSAGGWQIKSEFNYTDWDAITLSNTGAGVGSAKSITAQPEHWAAKIGIGYNF